MKWFTKGGPDCRVSRQPVHRNRRGLALVATLIVLAVMGIIVAGAVRAAMTTVRAASLDYHEARSFYAAEAGVEAALSQLRPALDDGHLDDNDLAAIHPPDLDGFDYDSFAVNRVGGIQLETVTDGPYVGLYSLAQAVEIYSVAADRTNTVYGVILAAKARAIPIFQFGVFYEEDLEGTNGPPLEFLGRVHSNGNIYLSSRNAWYREMITTPNRVFHDRKDNHLVQNGVYVNDDVGNAVQLTFDSRSLPDAEAFKAQSCANFACRLQTDAFDVDSLQLPLPVGLPPYELVRAREADDGVAEKNVKFAWKADAYLTVDLTQIVDRATACAGGGGDDEEIIEVQNWLPRLTIDRGGRPAPTVAELCSIFRWRWSGFYDGREGELEDVLDIRINKLRNWVGGDPARQMEIIYVDFIVPEDITGYPQGAIDLILDATVDPALRVVDGANLPNPMTVATEWPLYVRGSYNAAVGRKQPAALVGDGITILSSVWRDLQNRPPADVFTICAAAVSPNDPCKSYLDWAAGWNDRPAGATSVSAAILAGHWATPCDHEEPGCPGGLEDFYGGGIENFPRFLENWATSVPFRYRGSLVSLFTSQKTTGTWNLRYYVPPRRDWSFDTDFRDPALLPPGTPTVGNVVRTAMREAF